MSLLVIVWWEQLLGALLLLVTMKERRHRITSLAPRLFPPNNNIQLAPVNREARYMRIEQYKKEGGAGAGGGTGPTLLHQGSHSKPETVEEGEVVLDNVWPRVAWMSIIPFVRAEPTCGKRGGHTPVERTGMDGQERNAMGWAPLGNLNQVGLPVQVRAKVEFRSWPSPTITGETAYGSTLLL